MEPQNCYNLIHIGLLIRFLRTISANGKTGTIKLGLKQLEENLKIAGFQVSVAGLINLDPMKEIRKDLDLLQENDPIGEKISDSIKGSMSHIENIVYSEALTKEIFPIPQRRYNGDYLLYEPWELLNSGAFIKLSDIAQFDFISACRCLIFGESTACAFHILRTTEETLKQYYYRFIKAGRTPKPMWAQMVVALKNKKTKKPDENLLSSLDMIRVSYRNPTQHPEAIYDINEAQDLLGLCIDVLNKMTLVL